MPAVPTARIGQGRAHTTHCEGLRPMGGSDRDLRFIRGLGRSCRGQIWYVSGLYGCRYVATAVPTAQIGQGRPHTTHCEGLRPMGGSDRDLRFIRGLGRSCGAQIWSVSGLFRGWTGAGMWLRRFPLPKSVRAMLTQLMRAAPTNGRVRPRLEVYTWTWALLHRSHTG